MRPPRPLPDAARLAGARDTSDSRSLRTCSLFLRAPSSRRTPEGPCAAPRRSTLRPAALLAALFSIVALSPAPGAATLADRIVAVVNSDLITLSELKAETEAAESRLRAQHRGAELERRIRQAEFETLTKMIETKLQLQAAKKAGVEVTDDELKSAVKEMKRQGDKVDDSNPAVQRAIKEQIVLLKVVDREVRSTVMVSEVELQRYYMQHQGRFMLPDEYNISQILVIPHPGEDRAQARARAQATYAELGKGADFADLALRQSDGPEATKGGSLGFVRQGELLPPIERALATLEVGKITEPIETPLGLHIIRLDEKSPTGIRPFAEVRTEIQGLVYRQKHEDMFQTWLKELKNKAYIEVKF